MELIQEGTGVGLAVCIEYERGVYCVFESGIYSVCA
jgi:hypothetical protein